MADTVLPFVRERFAVRSDPPAVAVVGSSYRGLVSLVAASRRPERFGFVGALSQSLAAGDGGLDRWLDAHPASGLFTLPDVGTAEASTPPAAPEVEVERVVGRFVALGNGAEGLISDGAAHHQAVWAVRLPGVLERFLDAQVTEDRRRWSRVAWPDEHPHNAGQGRKGCFMNEADVVVVGGGIAGASVALVLARDGYRVTVLEKTRQFHDENRGELLWPWGVREARECGVLEVLLEAGGHVVRWIREHSDLEPDKVGRSDLGAVIEGVPGSVNLGHPRARQALLDAAERAGAHVVRGARDVEVSIGPAPSVRWTEEGTAVAQACRLVVGADGRHSVVRRQAGIELHTGPVELFAAGMLVRGHDIPADANVAARERDTLMLSFPQRDGYARLYHCVPIEGRTRFDGREGRRRLVAACGLDVLPDRERWLSAQPAGPCATFPCSDAWVASPVAEGVALVGDAGGYNNFLIGQGLSLAFRDVRVLTNLLRATDDWSPGALAAYAAERGERLARARYLAHLAGWKARFYRDAPAERAAAARLFAEDTVLTSFRGSVVAGYGADQDVGVDVLWERLDALEHAVVRSAAA